MLDGVLISSYSGARVVLERQGQCSAAPKKLLEWGFAQSIWKLRGNVHGHFLMLVSILSSFAPCQEARLLAAREQGMHRLSRGCLLRGSALPLMLFLRAILHPGQQCLLPAAALGRATLALLDAVGCGSCPGMLQEQPSLWIQRWTGTGFGSADSESCLLPPSTCV